MCEDLRIVRHLLLGLEDTHISTLNSNALPSDAFLDGLSLGNASTTKRAYFLVFAAPRRPRPFAVWYDSRDQFPPSLHFSVDGSIGRYSIYTERRPDDELKLDRAT
jgi:hypothetical protein